MKGIGRIANTVPGTAENSCAYVHASMFSIMALFAMGQSEIAWKEFEKSMVISHDHVSHSAFVMPNSYCENQELNFNGESLGDWYTGSGTVLIKGLVRFGFGLEPSLDGLTIQTPKFMPTNRASLTAIVKGCEVALNYENNNSGDRKYFINGKLVESVYDEITENKKVFINRELLKEKIIINVVD
jgi:cellobiose phosphorylase